MGGDEWGASMGGKEGGEMGSGEGYPLVLSSSLGVSLFEEAEVQAFQSELRRLTPAPCCCCTPRQVAPSAPPLSSVLPLTPLNQINTRYLCAQAVLLWKEFFFPSSKACATRTVGNVCPNNRKLVMFPLCRGANEILHIVSGGLIPLKTFFS